MNDRPPPPKLPDEHGVPDPKQYMHPIMKANYGKWDWHERPRPGVLHHVAKSGDEIWTVKAGTTRQMDAFQINQLCDIADEFCDGRFIALGGGGYNRENLALGWNAVVEAML